jgi:hypothetical protein
LLPDAGVAVDVPATAPHSLHCLTGAVEFIAAAGRGIGHLERGQSALVPVGVGGYRLTATAPAEVIRVNLPVS